MINTVRNKFICDLHEIEDKVSKQIAQLDEHIQQVLREIEKQILKICANYLTVNPKIWYNKPVFVGALEVVV